MLLALTAKGRKAHDSLFAGARERTTNLLRNLPANDVRMLGIPIEHLTEKAEEMLDREQDR